MEAVATNQAATVTARAPGDSDKRRVPVKWHEPRRIAIHTVAFGEGADKELMSGLAEDSGGTYLKK